MRLHVYFYHINDPAFTKIPVLPHLNQTAARTFCAKHSGCRNTKRKNRQTSQNCSFWKCFALLVMKRMFPWIPLPNIDTAKCLRKLIQPSGLTYRLGLGFLYNCLHRVKVLPSTTFQNIKPPLMSQFIGQIASFGDAWVFSGVFLQPSA